MCTFVDETLLSESSIRLLSNICNILNIIKTEMASVSLCYKSDCYETAKVIILSTI